MFQKLYAFEKRKEWLNVISAILLTVAAVYFAATQNVFPAISMGVFAVIQTVNAVLGYMHIKQMRKLQTSIERLEELKKPQTKEGSNGKERA